MQANVASTPHLRRIGGALTIASLAAILFATLLPAPGEPVASHLCLVCGTLGGVDSILNVLLFVPLGIGLALCGFPASRAILIMGLLSISIETAQLFVIPGRDATLGDVVTNAFGGAVGFAISRYARVWLRPTTGNAARFAGCWAAVWLLIQTISSFAFTPSIPASEYYGQLTPSLRDFGVFQGSVVRAAIDDILVPNTKFTDSYSLQRRLARGATVTATVISRGVAPQIAPIVRVATGDGGEIVLLAQNNGDLLFSVRSGAVDLRLRPPVFVLPNVFQIDTLAGDHGRADTIVITERSASNEVRMSARTDSGAYASSVPLTASLAWTLVLPAQWFIKGSAAELVTSWIWIACLVLPFGYWATHAYRSPKNQNVAWRHRMIWPVCVAIVYGGLALGPYAFGLAAVPTTVWLAALAGLLVGYGLAGLNAETTASRKPDVQLRGN